MALSTEYIVSDPGYVLWQAADCRIAVYVKGVVAHHCQRMSLEEIALDWNIPLAAVHAAMAYYYDDKAEIDRSFSDDRACVVEMKAETKSLWL